MLVLVLHVILLDLERRHILKAYCSITASGPGTFTTAASTTQVARIGVGTDDTFFFEPAYPISLTATNDTLVVENEGSAATAALNVIVLGDKEA